MSICYDFDNFRFKEILKQLHLTEPKDIKERYHLIIKIANKLLLS